MGKNWPQNLKQPFILAMFLACKGSKIDAMNFSCENINDSGTFITFLGSPRNTLCPVSSGILEPGSLLSSAGGKNCLWRLWPDPSYLLRSEDPQGSGLALWRDADLSGRGDPPSRLSKVPESEAGTV